MGQSRAAAATRNLVEMNHEVRGDAVEESPENILRNRPDFFRNFSLVVVTSMGERALKVLSELLWEANIPLVVIRSYGFVGYIRLAIVIKLIMYYSHGGNDS